MKVRYTDTAIAEIQEIFSYISKHDSSAAERVTGYIGQTIGLIEKSPELGLLKYRQIVRMLPVRRYPQYLLFYTIEKNEVVILNVRHAARRRPWEDDDQ
jgi:plasmid stabilization system protein ParE